MPGYGAFGGSESYWELDEQKFAELIVQECAQLAMLQHQSSSFVTYDDLSDYERGQDDTASVISGQIKQHFGVK